MIRDIRLGGERFLPLALAAALAPLLSCATQQSAAKLPYIIVGAQVADGTGGELKSANVRVLGDRIEAVGDLVPQPGEPVIAANGLVLAPGFIDNHNHSTEGLKTDPAAETQVAQGITTVVLGPDGE